MDDISLERKELILQDALLNLKDQRYDYEVALRVNKRVGGPQEETQKLSKKLVTLDKKIEAYKEELEKLEQSKPEVKLN